jgi:hypothetical protein
MRERRRAKEGHVENLPEQEGASVDVQDWRPILDEELNAMPEKYRAPLVLCDLEARPRKEAAEQLHIPEGTLSSRLAKGRKMLGARLARRGVTLTAGALTAALAQDSLAGPLVADTARVATLLLTGEVASLAGPVAVLVKGALTTMFMARFKVVGVLLLVACLTLGAGKVAYHPVEAQNAAPAGKPVNEFEALRRENALLKLNLEIVLEKVRAQAADLQAMKKDAAKARYARDIGLAQSVLQGLNENNLAVPSQLPVNIEDFLTKLRAARTDADRATYAEGLERYLRSYRRELENKKAPNRKKE